jgi:hypothetical protein
VRLPYARYLVALAALFPLLWLAAGGVGHLLAVTKCNGTPFPSDSYIAYCLDREYGDYEHEAFYFGLSRTADALAETRVLFLGNSKMQYAFSRANVAPFFAERRTTFFVMGFRHGEQSRFAELVLRRHPARPALAVINVDPFFTDGITEPAAFPVQHPIAGWIDAIFKSAMQRPRAGLCRAGPAPCSNACCAADDRPCCDRKRRGNGTSPPLPPSPIHLTRCQRPQPSPTTHSANGSPAPASWHRNS